jgi:hypothetical protein
MTRFMIFIIIAIILIGFCLMLVGCSHFDTNAFLAGMASSDSSYARSDYERKSLEYQRRQTEASEQQLRQQAHQEHQRRQAEYHAEWMRSIR